MRKIFIVGALALAAVFLFVACGGGAAGPVTRDFSIVLGEGEIIGEHEEEHDEEGEADEEAILGGFHRWEPSILVAFVGDTIRLTVTNPHGNAHSLVLDEFLVDTESLDPQGGSKTVEFVVDKAGIFQFACGLEYEDEETGELTDDCAPDHERMVGHFIVLDR
jgi:plastocyanin